MGIHGDVVITALVAVKRIFSDVPLDKLCVMLHISLGGEEVGHEGYKASVNMLRGVPPHVRECLRGRCLMDGL